LRQHDLPWIDGHLDLAYLAVRGRDLTAAIDDADADSACISLPALREANVEVAFATIYVDIGERKCDYGYESSEDIDGAERAALRQITVYEDLETRGEISIIRSRSDLARTGVRPQIVLLMEGCDPIRGPDDAAAWFDRGVRIFGLTWAKGSRYAGGNAKHGPLTPVGRELVHAIDEASGIHDLSHLSDPAAEELMEIVRGPVIASHSNSRSLMAGDNQRHLTDEMIRRITDGGGVIGLNLYSKFLADGRRATIGDCVRHIEHAKAVARSPDHVALGSDADGGFLPADLPINLDSPAKLPNLIAALAASGWSEADLAAFAHGNWRRLLTAALPA